MSEAGGMHPRDRLSAYLDDELPVDERSALDRHLALCTACRSELASLRALAAALRDEAIPAVPEDLALRIDAGIDAAIVTPIRKRRRFVVPATIAATIGAVGLLAVLEWRTEPERPYLPAPAAPSELLKRDADQAPAPAPSRERHAEASLPEIREEAKSNEGARREAAAPAAPAPKDERRDVQEFRTTVGGIAEAEADRPAAAKEKAAFDDLAAASAPPAAGRFFQRAGACGERWIDTGVLATWSVPDLASARRRLAALAVAEGGRGEEVEPYADQYAVVVPRERAPRLIDGLKAAGVSGLDASIAPEEGFDCVRLRVRLVP